MVCVNLFLRPNCHRRPQAYPNPSPNRNLTLTLTCILCSRVNEDAADVFEDTINEVASDKLQVKTHRWKLHLYHPSSTDPKSPDSSPSPTPTPIPYLTLKTNRSNPNPTSTSTHVTLRDFFQ